MLASDDSKPGLRRKFATVTVIAAEVWWPDAVTPVTRYCPGPSIHDTESDHVTGSSSVEPSL